MKHTTKHETKHVTQQVTKHATKQVITNTALPLSSYALIAANIIPLVGVLFFAWDSKVVLILYWVENLIIGLFNVVKMLSVGVLNRNKEAFFLSAFFVIHYGAFCSVHGSILVDILSIDINSWLVESAADQGGHLDGFLALYGEGLQVLNALLGLYGFTLWLGLGLLFLSHFASFIEHFILRGEIFNTQAKDLMTQPYKQIVVMHAGLLIGAIILEKLESPVWLLVIIVLFKVVIDYKINLKKHRRAQINRAVTDKPKIEEGKDV